MAPPALTALMPVRHYDPAYLAEALGSMTAQTSPSWQLLVIDDSADTALRTLLQTWTDDERITVTDNEGPRLAGAINTGMRHATTEFVALLFADDLWDPSAVATLTARISAEPEVDFFHSGRRFVDDDGQPLSGEYRPRRDVTLDDFRVTAPVKHLLCWRRAMGLAVGGLDETSLSVGPDDFDFPWTMAEHGARFAAVDECLYVYRDHRRVERLTTHLPLRVHVRELRRIFRKHGLSRRESARRVAAARAGYLQQCLHRNEFESTLRRWLGWQAPTWRETYHQE